MPAKSKAQELQEKAKAKAAFTVVPKPAEVDTTAMLEAPARAGHFLLGPRRDWKVTNAESVHHAAPLPARSGAKAPANGSTLSNLMNTIPTYVLEALHSLRAWKIFRAMRKRQPKTPPPAAKSVRPPYVQGYRSHKFRVGGVRVRSAYRYYTTDLAFGH